MHRSDDLDSNKFVVPSVTGLDDLAKCALSKKPNDLVWVLSVIQVYVVGNSGKRTLLGQFRIRDNDVMAIIVVNLDVLIVVVLFKIVSCHAR